MALLRYSRA